MSFFDQIPQLPEDPILHLPIIFAKGTNPKKVNLGIGAYKTAEGRSLVLNSVKKAEAQMLQQNLSKDYLPIEGDHEFLKYSLKLLFGTSSPFLQKGLFFTTQTVGGSSALRTGGEFLKRLITPHIFIPQPTWANHQLIFERAGFKVGTYPYINSKTHTLDFDGICEALRNMPEKSAVLLHGCCHNPTGLDPSFEQWKILSQIFKEQYLIPFFDVAYQGFGTGLDEDASAVRYFAENGHEMLVAYSYSKNFGLYGERVGFLTLTCSETSQVEPIASQIKKIVRSNYSNPPLHGERIITTILKSYSLCEEWKIELENMRNRISEMRKALIAELCVKGNLNLSYMQHQKGLFSYLGLDHAQIERLKNEFGIYMPEKGRINIAGLNTLNLTYVAEALLAVMKGT